VQRGLVGAEKKRVGKVQRRRGLVWCREGW